MGLLDSLGSNTSTTSTTTPGNNAGQALATNQLIAGFGSLPGGGLPGYTQFQPAALPGANELQTLGQIEQAGKNPNLLQPIEQFGLNEYAKATDPASRLAAAQQAYDQISAPTIATQLNAYGQGRSGALLEALSNNAVNQYTLPILTQIAQAQQGLGQQAISMGPTIESRTFSRLNNALQAEAAPRNAYMQEYLRPFTGLMNLLSGNAVNQNTGSTTVQNQSAPANLLTQFFVPMVTSLLAAGNKP